MESDSSARRRFGPVALAIKFGPKVLSFLFKSKAFWAAASFAAYSTIFSWKFVLILMGSVLFHELGHIRAMRVFGLKVKGVYFLPFMGGAAVGTGQVETRKADAYIALWGPLWGFALALATLDLYALTGSEYAAAVAAWMAALNLFNLLPVWPLDGGRLIASVARSAGTAAGTLAMVAGYAALGIGALLLKMPLFVFLLIAGGFELWAELSVVAQERERKALVRSLADAFNVEATSEDVARAFGERFARASAGDGDALPFSHKLGNGEIGVRFREQLREIPWTPAMPLAVRGALQNYLALAVSYAFDGDRVAPWVRLALNPDPSGFHRALLGTKQPDPMTPLQAAGAMAGYAFLVAALAAVLYAAQVNDVAGAALDIFHS